MRHRVAGHKLGRIKDEREALRRIMMAQLFEYERIKTTRAKAESVRGPAERLISLAKRGNQAGEISMVNARRLAASRLANPEAVKKLFDDIAPRYIDRSGGYTRIVKLGSRLGDSSEMVILELVE